VVGDGFIKDSENIKMKIEGIKVNIFKGLSWNQIGIVVTLGTLMAFIALVIISAVVYSLPISDSGKLVVFFSSGILCFGVGYFILKRIPPKTQQAKPQPITAAAAFRDVCNGTREINNNLFHSPVIPKRAITISSPPNNHKPNIVKAFTIGTSINLYFERFLSWVGVGRNKE
jgi:hypothetical protein